MVGDDLRLRFQCGFLLLPGTRAVWGIVAMVCVSIGVFPLCDHMFHGDRFALHNCGQLSLGLQCMVVLHASVVHASGSGQLQANPHVAGPWLSPGKPTRRVVTTMGSNDLVVGEVHMLGPSCQRHNWHTGRCGSIAFGSSPRRGKTLISNPRCLAEVSTRGKDFRK